MQAPDKSKVRRRPVSAAIASASSASTLFSRRDHNGILSLHGKDFVLDIENVRELHKMTTEIEKLGGRIVPEISDERKPFCVVSDSIQMEKIEKLKPEQITTQVMRCLPMLVRDAIRLGIRYRSCKAFHYNIEKLKVNIKTQKTAMRTPVKRAAPSTTAAAAAASSASHTGPIQLQQPFLKLEDSRGAFAPLYKQFTPQSNCQKVFLGKYMGKSLFHRNHNPDAPKTEKSPSERARQVHAPKGGYCEICCKKFDNSKEHFASREHTHHISQPGLWTSVDSLCGSFLDYVSSSNPRTRRHRPSPPSPSTNRNSL